MQKYRCDYCSVACRIEISDGASHPSLCPYKHPRGFPNTCAWVIVPQEKAEAQNTSHNSARDATRDSN